MTIRLLLFGSPTVDYGGESLALPFERRNQLLVFLALKRSWVGRAELASLLWPKQEAKLAYTNLRKTLHRLHSLRWAQGLESQGGALRFEAETDVFAFDAALREQRFADALPMRRGELLVGFDDDQSEAWSSWLNFERDRLRLAWRDAALNRLASDIEVGDAIDLSSRLLDADPLDEAALRTHMSWLARGGQTASARHAYHQFVKRLADDLGLAPGAELRALHDSLGTVVRPSVAAASGAAPARGDDFVGRTVELRRIGALLAQDDCRLICLMGPGGVGKTRLAQQAIHEFAPIFSDGAVFIPLEDIVSSSDLGGRLAREVGISSSGDALKQVIQFLCSRHMLLVLDNFEHLAAEAAMIGQLLHDCPRLKIIVTSRVRLALSIEWVLPLEGLPCPELEDQDRLEAFDAARLFVKVARRVEPAFVASVEAASIIDICRQVEGSPLALQLAAAWTRVLPCDAIASELRQGTELLHAIDTAHPARHASIEVVFDQSWRLLSATERDALSRLSVFHGGFTADAARVVAGARLAVLGALADKSLLRKDSARIFLHPLVQQLSAARLSESPAHATTHAAHAAYFHQLLAQVKPAVGTGERAALKTIDVEFENCRRAWAWSIDHDQPDAIARSATVLLDYWDHRGRWQEGLALLRIAIESSTGQNDERLQALLLSRASHLEYRLGRYDEAEATASRALGATRKSRDVPTKMQALNVLATCALYRGRLEDARRYFKQTLDVTSPENKAGALAATLDHLALVEKALGNYPEAMRLSLQSLVQYRALSDSAEEALCLNNLGSLCLAIRDDKAANSYLHEALAICDRDGIVSTRGLVLGNLTEVALRTGDFAAAETHANRALEAATATGNRTVACWVRTKLARSAAQRGDIDAARAVLAEASAVVLELAMPSLKIDALRAFAELLVSQGETLSARRVLAHAADHPNVSAPARDDIQARLKSLPPGSPVEPDWPELELDQVLHRVVAESKIAHAPLIATLRGTTVRVAH